MILVGLGQAFHDGTETANDYSNEWVVNLEGSEEAASFLAAQLGYENVGEVYTIQIYVIF